MQNQPNPQPWWTRTNKETLDDRVKAVQNVSDPSIMSDDVQRWSRIALIALLAFTTLLSGASYSKFFEKSFGFEAAFVMALLLACIIEFGKNWGFLKVLRIPFFLGWRYVSAEVQNTIMWVFLLFLSAVTFAASIYNSTQGAHQLSMLLSHERTYNAFIPNTSDLDAQIADLQKQDGQIKLTRKNGRTNWAAQPIKAENAKTLASLQQQRETAIAQQRADWEKQTAIQEQQNNFSANSLLAVGGWVELLQIILMFVRVSAERSLDKTAAQRRQQVPYPTGNGNGHYRPFQPRNEPAQNGIGFFWPNYGHPKDALDKQPLWHNENTVAQSPQTVPQSETAADMSYADTVLEVCRQAIQRDISNFHNRQAKPETVANRIHQALNKCYGAMSKAGSAFDPSYHVGLKLYAYLQDTVFPTLDGVGYPFEGETFFLDRLYQSFKKAEPAPR